MGPQIKSLANTDLHHQDKAGKNVFIVVFFFNTIKVIHVTHSSDSNSTQVLAIKTGRTFARSLAAFLWLSVSVINIFKDVSLTVHKKRLSCHTCKTDMDS